MATYLAPGVFIEEVPSAVQVIQGVSTSTAGFVGFTPRGPVNEPTLVTSPEQYDRVFGSLSANSFLPLSVLAFFANQGRRAYIVRVVPSDAVAADAKVQSQTYDQEIETGDGASTNFAKTSATTLLKANGGASPLVSSSLTCEWRATGSAVSSEPTMERDGTTPLVTSTTVRDYEGRIDPAALEGYHDGLDQVVPGTVTIAWDGGSSSVAVTATTRIATGTSADGTVIVDCATGIFSLRTTFFPTTTGAVEADYNPAIGDPGTSSTVQVNTAGLPDGAVDCTVDAPGVAGDLWTITVDASLSPDRPLSAAFVSGSTTDILVSLAVTGGVLVPASNTATLVAAAIDALAGVSAVATGTGASSLTVSEVLSFSGGADSSTYYAWADDGAGNIASSVGRAIDTGGTNTLSYTDGSYDFDVETTAVTATPYNTCPLLATYLIEAWDMNPVSAGEWGNDLRVDVSGNVDNFTPTTGVYTKFDVVVYLKNSLDVYELQESYEELDFSDSTSVLYFPDVINQLSDLVTVTEPGGDEAPGQLSAVERTFVVAGGDGSTGGKNIQFTLPEIPIQLRTFSLVFTSSGASLVITDDGEGNLTGSVDAAGTNTINYTTGVVDVTTVDPMDVNTLAVVTYRTEVEETTHQEEFGDTTKGYTQGDDGTFTTSTYGRDQFTSPTLQANSEGIFALNRVSELLQVAIPDFAGDTTITGDIIDYIESRTVLPSGGDRFAILAVPLGSSAQEAVDWFRITLGRFSDYAALYWPWVNVADPLSDNRPLTMPPLGHIAGVYARTDANHNVAKSPGGTVDGKLNFLLDLEMVPTLGERELVAPNKINALVSSPETGLAVWGVRTISQGSDFRYVSVRRLFMFLEKSIYNATQWVVFENNGPDLWLRIKTQLDAFLLNLFNEGYFAGTDANQAFRVKVDADNNPPESVDAGKVFIDIGVAPQRPAEFVVFRFSQRSLEA